MIWKAVLLAAVLAGPVAAQGRPPAKPAAPRASAPAPAAFDATNPQAIVGLLTTAGAKASPSRREEDSVFVAVTSAAADFSVQFAGCDASGRSCQAVLFDALLSAGSPSLPQINGFNQSSVVCRLYEDKAGKTHATYAALLLKSDTRDSGRTHLAAWRGCLTDALAFAKDPIRYLAEAP